MLLNLLISAVLALPLSPADRSVQPTPVADAAASRHAWCLPTSFTVLRKLHLVRPDLIPYPLAFDIVC